MTDPKALREKLAALAEDKERELGFLIGVPGCFREVALDLLARLEAAEAPCVWSRHPEGGWFSECGARDYGRFKFCPGCGHPVQVKQPQDAAREEK